MQEICHTHITRENWGKNTERAQTKPRLFFENSVDAPRSAGIHRQLHVRYKTEQQLRNRLLISSKLYRRKRCFPSKSLPPHKAP